MSKENITIEDVARAAGVSKATVSRYINQKYDLISAATRDRIESVIQLSHYRPNDIARSLKSRKSMFIGVIIADISSPFSSALVHAISNTLTDEGYVPLFIATNNDFEREKKAYDFLMTRSVDGLIVNTNSINNPQLIGIACQEVPVVLCDREINEYQFEAVVVNNRKIMDEIMSYLKGEGYADVLFFSQTGWENISSRIQRQRYYLDGMRKYFGVEDASDRIYFFDPDAEDSAVRGLQRLTEESRKRTGGVPAIVTVNNVVTIALLIAIRRLGLHMPDEVGLCGSDDWGWSGQMNWAEISSPAVTTYRFNSYEVGRTTASALITRIRHPETPKQFIKIPWTLCARGSTALRESTKE